MKRDLHRVYYVNKLSRFFPYFSILTVFRYFRQILVRNYLGHPVHTDYRNHNIYLERLRPVSPRASELLVDFDWSFRLRLSKRLDKSKLIFCLFSVIKEDRSSCLRLEAKEDESAEVDDLVPSPQDNSRFSVLSLENLPKDVCSLDVDEVSLRPLLFEVGIILKCSIFKSEIKVFENFV